MITGDSRVPVVGILLHYAPMSKSLFTYGTLEIPQVAQIITGQVLTGAPARLEGYARYQLKNHAYPGIIQEVGASITGTLYLDLDDMLMAQMDEYEDTCYEKRRLQVLTGDGMTRDAQAYVVPEENRELLSSQPWDREHFIREELDAFLRSIMS
ncbi:MAG TPA: gamma-glutamylcyclotransferase [Gammaproteobacteria bacterium]|nr:gamma-glutamylcyclotransferase [Gammaproteobacteria bacterium]